VRKEEPLVEIQTDKINVEIPSPAEGVLQSISVPEGTTVLVGTEIGVLGGAEEAAAAPAPAAKPLPRRPRRLPPEWRLSVSQPPRPRGPMPRHGRPPLRRRWP
jgi:2-oxoglutarate dehydrogenase E2 component (dihydrolipoamide succinyltransferase)